MLAITLIGMGTVFLVLLGLSFILDGLRMTLGPEEHRSRNKKANENLTEVSEEVSDTEETSENNQEELVAVLTAAIAQFMGKGAPEFRVTYIHRIPMSTPVWSQVSRTRKLPQHSNSYSN